MRHNLCRSFHPWCPGVKNRCLLSYQMYDISMEASDGPGIFSEIGYLIIIIWTWFVFVLLWSVPGLCLTILSAGTTKQESCAWFLEQNICLPHYSDVIMSAMASQSPASRLFTQPFVQAAIKKTSKLCITGLCEGNPPLTGRFPHKGPVTRKMFPFENVFIYSIQSHEYRKISNIRRTQNQNLNDSRHVMQLPLPNPSKPGVKSRMKM